jgi:hypothetical protein
MKLWIGFTLIVLTSASCTSTRLPAYEDALDAGAVRGGTRRPAEAGRTHPSYEDAIDAGSVDPVERSSSSRTEKPSAYEDAIDAGRPHAISKLSVPERERELAAARVGDVLSRLRA